MGQLTAYDGPYWQRPGRLSAPHSITAGSRAQCILRPPSPKRQGGALSAKSEDLNRIARTTYPLVVPVRLSNRRGNDNSARSHNQLISEPVSDLVATPAVRYSGNRGVRWGRHQALGLGIPHETRAGCFSRTGPYRGPDHLARSCHSQRSSLLVVSPAKGRVCLPSARWERFRPIPGLFHGQACGRGIVGRRSAGGQCPKPHQV